MNASLPPRQQQILELLAAGTSRAAIAAQLRISRSTVKTQIKRIYTHLDAANVAHAVAIGYQRGLLGRQQ